MVDFSLAVGLADLMVDVALLVIILVLLVKE